MPESKQSHPRPTPEQITAAVGKSVPDLIGPGLTVLFCGINPSLYTAAVGHHFARPGNRFWPALFGAGYTDRLLSPFEEGELLARGYGIVNLVNRATASAAQLTRQELVAGGQELRRKVGRLRPAVVAVLGVEAYRTAFGQPRAQIGRQEQLSAASRLWVLPNPSGLNASYQLPGLIRLFTMVREEAEQIVNAG